MDSYRVSACLDSQSSQEWSAIHSLLKCSHPWPSCWEAASPDLSRSTSVERSVWLWKLKAKYAHLIVFLISLFLQRTSSTSLNWNPFAGHQIIVCINCQAQLPTIVQSDTLSNSSNCLTCLWRTDFSGISAEQSGTSLQTSLADTKA